MNAPPTVHATAVLVGSRALLIRGPAGAGKSRLALQLLQFAGTPALPFARLVGDDRVHLAAANGRLLVRPAAPLQGMIEVRGLGLRRMPFEPVAVVGRVVDLGDTQAQRLPDAAVAGVSLEGIALPRLAVAPHDEPLPAVLAFLDTAGLSA
jgi:hypothetical protein